MDKEKNEPAFPTRFAQHTDSHGMTLRDWFAGMALQGMLSDSAVRDIPEGFAATAYELADAMLEARNG